MKTKRIISVIIILILVSAIILIYAHFYSIKKAEVSKEEAVHSEIKRNAGLHIIKDFSYNHYKRGKLLFSLKAKEHFLAEDQRSEFKDVSVIVYDASGNQNYNVSAKEGILPKGRNFVILRNRAEVSSNQGWEIKTHALTYTTDEEKLEFPHHCNFEWEKENLRGKSDKMNYYPKKHILELAGKVMLVRKKEQPITINADYIVIREKGNEILIRGNPAKILQPLSFIKGNEFIITRIQSTKSFKDLRAEGGVFFFYRREGRESIEKELNNIKAKGNSLVVNFDNLNNITSWDLYNNAIIRVTFFGDKKDVKDTVCILKAPSIKGIYDERGKLQTIEASDKVLFKLVNHLVNLRKSLNGYSKAIKININEGEDKFVSKIDFGGGAELTTADGTGRANRIEHILKEERTILRGEASWATKELVIQADEINYDGANSSLKALKKDNELIRTMILSNKKGVLRVDHFNPITILSEEVYIRDDVARFVGEVSLLSAYYAIHAGEIEFYSNKEIMIANKISDFHTLGDNKDENYFLKADKLIYEKGKKEFRFSSNIYMRALKSNLTIQSGKMSIMTDNSDNIEKILMNDKVMIKKGQIDGVCEKASYEVEAEEIIMEGRSSLSKAGKNKIQGDKLILDTKKETVVAIGNNYKRVEGLYYEEIKEENKDK